MKLNKNLTNDEVIRLTNMRNESFCKIGQYKVQQKHYEEKIQNQYDIIMRINAKLYNINGIKVNQ